MTSLQAGLMLPERSAAPGSQSYQTSAFFSLGILAWCPRMDVWRVGFGMAAFGPAVGGSPPPSMLWPGLVCRRPARGGVQFAQTELSICARSGGRIRTCHSVLMGAESIFAVQ